MNEEYFSAECPICCYTASGRDELRVETRVEDQWRYYRQTGNLMTTTRFIHES
jgi:hypothetical protein